MWPIILKDNHPKYVVTMDELRKDNIEGVKHVLHIFKNMR